MDFQLLFLKNFKNHSNTKLDLTKSRVWIFRGKNSSGKSTLACDAITYALFGEINAMRGRAGMVVLKDDLIKRGATKMEVTVKFVFKGEMHSITRKRSKNLEVVTLSIGGVFRMEEEKSTVANGWIEKNLLTFNDFRNTSMILQDEMTHTLKMARSDREEYLVKLFGIDEFDNYKSLASAKRKVLLVEVSKLDVILHEKQKHSIDAQEKQKELIASKQNLKSVIKSLAILAKKIDKKNELLKRQYNIKLERNQIHESIDSVAKKLDELLMECKTQEMVIAKIHALFEAEPEFKIKLKKIEKLEAQLKDYSELQQDVTELEMSKKKWENVIDKKEASLKARLVELETSEQAYDERFHELQTEIDELTEKETKIEKLKRNLEDYDQVIKEFTKLKKNREHFTKIEKLITKHKATLDAMKKDRIDNINKKEKEIKELKHLQRKLTALERQESKIKILLQDKVAEENEIQKTRVQVSEVIIKENVLTTEIEHKNQLLNEKRSELKEIQSLDAKSRCPKCLQPLSKEHQGQISTEIRKESQKLSLEIATKKKELVATKKLHREVKASLNEKLNAVQHIEDKIQAIEEVTKEHPKIVHEIKRLHDIKQEVMKLTSIGLNELFPQEQKIFSEYETTQNKLDYSEEKFEAINTKMQKMAQDKGHFQVLEQDVQKKDRKIRQRIKVESKQSEIQPLKLEIVKTLSKSNFELDARETIQAIAEKLRIKQKLLLEYENAKQSLLMLNPSKVRKKLDVFEKKRKELLIQETKVESSRKQQKMVQEEMESKKLKLTDKRFSVVDNQILETEEALSALDNQNSKEIINKTNFERDIKDDEAEIKDQEKLQVEISKGKAEMKKNRKQIDQYQQLEEAFGKIGGYILSRLRVQINQESANIFEMLGSTQLQGIKLDENYDLKIQTPRQDENPEFFSGGLKIRIGFAFRLALSKVLAEYRESTFDSLIIDEGGFGALDQDGQNGVIDVFKSLEGYFKRMVIISHIQNIANNLPGESLFLEDGAITNNEIAH